MTREEKTFIDDNIEALQVTSAVFIATCIEMTRYMISSGDCQEYLNFYTNISLALASEEEVSYEEKKHFFLIHKNLLEYYTQDLEKISNKH